MRKIFLILFLFTTAFYPVSSAQAQSKKEHECRVITDFFVSCMLYGIKTNKLCLNLGNMVNSRIGDINIANSCVSFCSTARELKLPEENIKKMSKDIYDRCLLQ